MNIRQILSVLLIMLGTIAAILPSKSTKFRKFTADELNLEVTKDTYYISADELAHLLITGDPSFQLIDIRTEADADTMLTRAMNIPADSVLSINYEWMLYQRIKKTILYSDDVEAMQAVWKKLKYQGYPNIYLLRGGLNAWNQDILDPKYPGPSAPQDEIDLYNQRMASRAFFTGAKALPKVEFNVIMPTGGKKKKKVQGGCS